MGPAIWRWIMHRAGARIDFLKKEHKHVKRRNTTKHYA
ncbi:hypothetical protein B4096_0619 [Heyndrickxia coagulans]|nr:hypothetical protein B4096_0619 [Heyndrickxia coagulans]